MNKTVSLAAAVLLGMASSGAMAVEAGSGFVAGEFGYSQVDVDLDGVGSDQDDDRMFAVRGGWWFTPNLAVEGFYTNLYDYSETGYSAELDGWGLGLVARKNFGADDNGFYLQGRAGIFRADGRAEEVGFVDISGNSTKPYFGVGLGYDFSRNVGLGLNYTVYRADFDDLSVDSRTLSAVLELRF